MINPARGILKKCVTSEAVYPLSEQHGLKARERRYTAMRKESTGSRSESRPEWEQLEDWVRSQVQRLIQELLEEEVTEFLGRRSRRSDPTRTQIPAIGTDTAEPEAYAEFGNDTAEAAASPRYRGAVREPAAAAVRQQDQEDC